MILHALNDYYDRKAMDSNGGIAPQGFEYKEIPFVIVLDEFGNLVQIEDNRYQDGKWTRAKSFLVPQAEKRTVGVKAHLLWDNAEYVFGIVSKSRPDRVVKQHKAFLFRILELGLECDEGIRSICTFLSGTPIIALERSEFAEEIKETNPFISFRLNSETNLVCERENVIEKVMSTPAAGKRGICLITGNVNELSNLQPSIKGIRGTNSTGGNLVSFNLPSFNSFGKEQGGNAQISEKATFSYTTALNQLLSKDSKQKIQIGDATTIFWSEKISNFENDFSSLFEQPPKDNPDQLTDSVKTLFKAVETGALQPEECSTRFFVLGLSPNAARVSVRFWLHGNISDFSARILQHYRDLELVHAPYQRDHLPLLELLCSTAILGKIENINPSLGGDWMRCILAGLPYPESLFQAVLRRICADRDVNYPRVSILKACINRKSKYKYQPREEITVSLDKENCNPGYRLGRLFATLEKIQEESNTGINATIRDRYYSAASGTPASVMPILMRLKNHHLAKLDDGKSIYFEKLLGNIIGELTDFPSKLSLQDQGRFAIGYYHQRQAFFTKS